MFPAKDTRRFTLSACMAALLGTVVTASSYAAEVNLGFELGFMPAMLEAEDDTSWNISDVRAQNGQFSLVSDTFTGSENYLWVYTGDTEGGTVSFSYYLEGSCCVDLVVNTDPFGQVDVEVVVDGDEDSSGYNLSSGGWHSISFSVDDNSDYVQLIFSHSEMDSGEGEPEPRIWLDDFVVTGIVGHDDDGDGIFSSDDNCPLIANQDQTNSDHLEEGDVCDDDDDNDGLTDAQEALYDFLDPTYPNDAGLDHDRDGLSNHDEIQMGFDPAQANVSFPVDLTNYFPLGEILWKYRTDNSEGTLSSAKGEKENVFIYSGSTTRSSSTGGNTYHYEESATYEVREDGVYLLQSFSTVEIPGGDFRIEYSISFDGGILQVPFAANLNTTVTVQAETQIRRWKNGVEQDVPDGTIYRNIVISAGSNFAWNSNAVKTVALSIIDANDPDNNETYAHGIWRLGEGMGRLNTLDYFPFFAENALVDMQVKSRYGEPDPGSNGNISSPTDSPTRETGGEAGSGGGGTLDWWFVALLGAAGLYQLRRR